MASDREEYRHISNEELKNSLCEYAGFKRDGIENRWVDPGGKHCAAPDVLNSLDAVFHWLMPKIQLIRIDFIGSGILPDGEISEWQVGIASRKKTTLNQVYGFAKSPSEALCRAINNLISDKDGRDHLRVAID